MKPYKQVKVAKRENTAVDLLSFAEYLKTALPETPVKIGDSEYYGIHLTCKFMDGECEILDEGTDTELVLYTKPEAAAGNQETFNRVVSLFEEWSNKNHA